MFERESAIIAFLDKKKVTRFCIFSKKVNKASKIKLSKLLKTLEK